MEMLKLIFQKKICITLTYLISRWHCCYFKHPVCGHVRLHPALVAVHRPGVGTAPEWAVCPIWPLGRWQLLPADQDPGGLLLLRERPPRAPPRPRPVLCGDGPRHDWCHIVSKRSQYDWCHIVSKGSQYDWDESQYYWYHIQQVEGLQYNWCHSIFLILILIID